MLKGLFLIIIVIFLVGAFILLLVVNYIVSLFRRIRRGMYGDDSSDNGEENMRRHSNQYSCKRTVYTRHTGGQDDSRQSHQRAYASGKEPGGIVDTRDPQKANRQIISDDEGEYVDFIEEN